MSCTHFLYLFFTFQFSRPKGHLGPEQKLQIVQLDSGRHCCRCKVGTCDNCVCGAAGKTCVSCGSANCRNTRVNVYFETYYIIVMYIASKLVCISLKLLELYYN